MECTRIKDLLSEYVDGMLDGQTEARVEEHLSTCQGCKQELAGLKALVKELSALESVTAPKDFLDQVHERMGPRFSLRKVLRMLFVPARIKIPLELAAAAAMVVLVLVVFNVQHPKQQRVSGPGVTREVLIAGKSEVPAAAKPTAQKGIVKSEPSFEAVAVRPPDTERAPIELALLLTSEISGSAYAPSEAMDAVPALRKAEGETRVLMDAAPKAKMKMRALQEEKRGARLPPKEITALKDETKPAPSYVDQTLSKVNKIIESADGKVLSTQHAKESGQPRSILAEIPAEHYNAFCEALRKLGKVQPSPPALPETDQEAVQVHIRLISN